VVGTVTAWLTFFHPSPCKYPWWFALAAVAGGLVVLFTDTMLAVARLFVAWRKKA
jgi:hypothetical protein